MRVKIINRLLLAGILAVLAWPENVAAEEGTVNLQATLVLAKQEAGEADPRLEAIESKLRKMFFKFSSYQHYGAGKAAFALPGNANLDLGKKFKLQVKASPAEKGNIRCKVKWTRGKQMLINTTVVMKPGVPTILGGPSHEGGNLIVVLTAQ